MSEKPILESQELYARRTDGHEKLSNFFPSLMQMRMCGSAPYYRVKLIPDESGCYFTWHNYKENTFCFTNENKMGVEICFPYGSKSEEELGRGKLIRVRVEILEVLP